MIQRILALVVLCALALTVHLDLGDLKAYSAAFEEFANGRNPYAVSSSLSLPEVWNPPLFFIFLNVIGFGWISPDLLPLWTFLQCGLLVLVALTFRAARASEQRRLDSVSIALLILIPVFMKDFELGQFGILLLSMWQVSILLLERRRLVLSGLVLALASFKPHVGFVVIGSFVLSGKYRPLIVSYGVGILVLSLTAELFLPGVHGAWLSHVTEAGGMGGSNMLTALRLLFDIHNPQIVFSCLVLIVLVALILGHLAVSRSEDLNLSERELVYYLLALSALLSPFGYIFDFAILFPCYALLTARGFDGIGERRTVLLLTLPLVCYSLFDNHYLAGLLFPLYLFPAALYLRRHT